jgi:hypothetical protein
MSTEHLKKSLPTIEFSAPINFIYDDIDLPTSTMWQTQVNHELQEGMENPTFSAAVKKSAIISATDKLPHGQSSTT